MFVIPELKADKLIWNEYSSITQVFNADSTDLDSVRVSNPGIFSLGDTVMFIQMKGVETYFPPDPRAGKIRTDKVYNAGLYALMLVSDISGDIIQFSDPLPFMNPPIAGEVNQLVKVRGARTLHIPAGDTLTCKPWDAADSTGGVVVLLASESIKLDGTIDVSARGFHGGDTIPNEYVGPCVNSSTEYFPDSDSDSTGLKGEGIIYDGFPFVRGKGFVVNAGGSGNGKYAGGAGGGNLGQGGTGGYESEDCGNFNLGAEAGNIQSLFYTNTGVYQNRIFMGGGGGAGTMNRSLGKLGTRGGNGGGIIILITDTLISGDATLAAKGESVVDTVTAGAGGGGGGGVIILAADRYMGTLNIDVSGGNGGWTNDLTNKTGPGGFGGGGAIWHSGPSIPANVITNTDNGIRGEWTDGAGGGDGYGAFSTSSFTGDVLDSLIVPIRGISLNFSTDTLIDERDGEKYNIVRIGNQWWMAENLRATTYSDGTALIDGASAGSISGDDSTKYYFWYNNDSANYAETYGANYTWAAAMNGMASSDANPSGVQGICPTGWNIPSDADWKELEMYLGMNQSQADGEYMRGTDEGGKLKEAGLSHWNSPNTGATNSSGFTALPMVRRYPDVWSSLPLGDSAFFWSSTQYDDEYTWYRGLASGSSGIVRFFDFKEGGLSVRCVKEEDIPALALTFLPSHTTSINGNDGSIDLIATGGLPPYSYQWSNGSIDEDVYGLSDGVYKVTVTDSRDSIGIDSIRIYATFVDDRDSTRYKAVTIGDQIWMAENLKATQYTDSTPLVDGTGVGNIAGDYTTKYYFWYDDDSVNYATTYGLLYSWAAATYGLPGSGEDPIGVQGVCPSGWHLPSEAEWTTLTNYLGGSTIAGGSLKETGLTHWQSPNAGATNSSGFAALPGSYRGGLGFDHIGISAYFWSATESTDSNAYIRFLTYNTTFMWRDMGSMDASLKSSGASVRCVKEKDTSALALTFSPSHTTSLNGNDGSIDLSVTGGFPPYSFDWSNGATTEDVISLSAGVYSVTITDARDSIVTDSIRIYDTFKDSRDEQIYKAITIGNQTWMAENLNAVRFNDVTPIPNISVGLEWSNLVSPAYCWYDNDSAMYSNPYGALYNWYTVETGDLCPTGWHIPTDSTWTVLVNYLGGTSAAVDKLKDTGTAHWDSPNTGTNETGFTALPAGELMDSIGVFYQIGESGMWWSASETDSLFAQYQRMSMFFRGTEDLIKTYISSKKAGFSVRCVKDTIECLIDSLQLDRNNMNCHGDTIGSIITSVFGSSTYTYSWNSGQVTKNITGLTAGWYKVNVTDTIGCTISDSIEILQPDALLAEITDSINISCFGESDGTATVTPSGGTSPYQYQWNDDHNNTESTVTGLAANQDYQVSVADANGCSNQTSVNLSQPDELQIQGIVNDITCHGLCNGSIVVNASGGTQPYNYHWNNPLYSGNDTLYDLCSGIDTLEVIDANGCSEMKTFEISEPDSLHLELTVIQTCFNDSSGIINSEVSGGTPPYYYLWNNSLTSPGLSGLNRGVYTLTVTDANNCVISATDSIVEYQGVITGQIAGHTNVIAAGLYLYSVNEKFASTFTWTVNGGNIVSGQGTNFINVQWGPAGAGLISVIETDELGCKGDTVSLDITIGSTGIMDFANDELRIYPNPASDIAIIEYPNPENKKYTLILTDLAGKVVHYQDNIFTDRIEVYWGDLSPGLIIIELKGPKIFRGKIVIE